MFSYQVEAAFTREFPGVPLKRIPGIGTVKYEGEVPPYVFKLYVQDSETFDRTLGRTKLQVFQGSSEVWSGKANSEVELINALNALRQRLMANYLALTVICGI